MKWLTFNLEGWTRERREFFIVFEVDFDFQWECLRLMMLNQEVCFYWGRLWQKVKRVFGYA